MNHWWSRESADPRKPHSPGEASSSARGGDYGVSEIALLDRLILRELRKSLDPTDKIHQPETYVITSAIRQTVFRWPSSSSSSPSSSSSFYLGRVENEVTAKGTPKQEFRSNPSARFSGNKIGAGGVQSLIGRACRSISDPWRIVGRNYNISAAFHTAYRARLVREKGEERERRIGQTIIPVNLLFCKREYIVSSAASDHPLASIFIIYAFKKRSYVTSLCS